MRDTIVTLDTNNLDSKYWKTLLPQVYRVGFYHPWADYNVWSGRYFIETLGNPDDKSLYIDDAKALYLSHKSLKMHSIDVGQKDIRLAYVAKDGSVYTYGQELEWKLIMKENSRLQFLGRPSNVVEIQDLKGSRSFRVDYYNWYFKDIWNHMVPELFKKSLIGEVLGVVFELKEGNNVVGTAYYRPHYNDRLKCIIEMEDQNFSYPEFALMYAVAMNHAHPYGIRTDKTCSLYNH
jgi:hypothetical protein